MRRCEDGKVWRWADVKMGRCEDEQMWRWADVKMNRCEDGKVWRWEDVKMGRCEDAQMWRWEDVKMRGCKNEKMWRWEDVKMSRCEDERMWRWDVKMRCEDEKMFYRPPLLEEPCAQTLSGKIERDSQLEMHRAIEFHSKPTAPWTWQPRWNPRQTIPNLSRPHAHTGGCCSICIIIIRSYKLVLKKLLW